MHSWANKIFAPKVDTLKKPPPAPCLLLCLIRSKPLQITCIELMRQSVVGKTCHHYCSRSKTRVKRGLYSRSCPECANNIWEGWSLQTNFMYALVLWRMFVLNKKVFFMVFYSLEITNLFLNYYDKVWEKTCRHYRPPSKTCSRSSPIRVVGSPCSVSLRI